MMVTALLTGINIALTALMLLIAHSAFRVDIQQIPIN
jgi:hypothetical protein